MTPAELRRFGFLTLPNYSMIACANAIEALRMANRVAGAPAYEWRLLTLDGAPAKASNGLALHPTTALKSEPPFDVVFVCGGVDIREATGKPLAAALRGLAAKGISLGGLCTGAFALAEAGLLQGRRCAIHWENLNAIAEEFPDVDFVDDLYAVDGDRLTCTGGVAPLDMMANLIAMRFGADLAHKVFAQFIVERERSGAERQPGLSNLRAIQGRADLIAAVTLLESDRRDASPAAAAKAAGLSVRQLERLFARHLGETPAAFAKRLRLLRAQALLQQTALSITDVAVACGFTSPAHFATVYRRAFGLPPSAARRASSKDHL